MPTVRSIRVELLFGRYSYSLDAPIIDGKASRLMLLHGDNGSGKTTLLNLTWNLLSTDELKGHKSSIARTPFREFKVEFGDGRSVLARKVDGLIGSFDLTVAGPQLKSPITGTFLVNEDLDVSPTPGYGVSKDLTRHVTLNWDRQLTTIYEEPQQESVDVLDEEAPPMRRVMAFLRGLGMMPMLLGDDRELHSDNKRITRARASAKTVERGETSAKERVAQELKETLARVNDWLRSLTIDAQRLGSYEEATIYLNVLRRLGEHSDHSAPEEVRSRVEEAIDDLAKRVPDFAEFELVNRFDPEDIRSQVASVTEPNLAAADAILLPYLESMRARLEALTEAERLIRLVTSHANRYLKDKRLVYSPQPGLRVVTDEEEPRTLRPASLSSGERQMLLLLCSALLARVERTLFLIDEPELSLGVPWQRQILSSLLECTEGTDVQFIVATHSIEIVTANAPSLVRLENRIA